MLGEDLRNWFELFDGIVIYKSQPGGGHVSDGWLNWTAIEGRFKSEKLAFMGLRYDPSNEVQRNKLLEALVGYSNTLVRFRLLEKRRQIFPPSLDYRVTAFGRRVSNWGYGANPEFKKKALFFAMALVIRAYRLRWIVVFGAVGWGILNSVRFYMAAASWVESLPFAAWSAAAIAIVGAAYVVVKAKLSGSE